MPFSNPFAIDFTLAPFIASEDLRAFTLGVARGANVVVLAVVSRLQSPPPGDPTHRLDFYTSTTGLPLSPDPSTPLGIDLTLDTSLPGFLARPGVWDSDAAIQLPGLGGVFRDYRAVVAGANGTTAALFFIRADMTAVDPWLLPTNGFDSITGICLRVHASSTNPVSVAILGQDAAKIPFVRFCDVKQASDAEFIINDVPLDGVGCAAISEPVFLEMEDEPAAVGCNPVWPQVDANPGNLHYVRVYRDGRPPIIDDIVVGDPFHSMWLQEWSRTHTLVGGSPHDPNLRIKDPTVDGQLGFFLAHFTDPEILAWNPVTHTVANPPDPTIHVGGSEVFRLIGAPDVDVVTYATRVDVAGGQLHQIRIGSIPDPGTVPDAVLMLSGQFGDSAPEFADGFLPPPMVAITEDGTAAYLAVLVPGDFHFEVGGPMVVVTAGLRITAA